MGNISEAWRRALQLSYSHIRCKKPSLAHERNPDMHSLEAIGILKKMADKGDKYLMYKINNSKLHDNPHHMFKIIQVMAEVPTEMDQKGPDSPI